MTGPDSGRAPAPERLATLEVKVDRLEATVQTLVGKVDGVRLDIHAAKVGGRWLLGVALGFGGLVGWVLKLWASRPGAP